MNTYNCNSELTQRLRMTETPIDDLRAMLKRWTSIQKNQRKDVLQR